MEFEEDLFWELVPSLSSSQVSDTLGNKAIPRVSPFSILSLLPQKLPLTLIIFIIIKKHILTFY